MSLLELLLNNKGNISSALSKQLAKEVLSGKYSMVKEAIDLVHYDLKSVRCGAAKLVEKVAEEKPELVVPDLENLLPVLNSEDPQIRWMMIHIFGLCAKLKSENQRNDNSIQIDLLKEFNIYISWKTWRALVSNSGK